MKTVLVSGGFDPLHSGHLAYLQAAKQLGDRLVVGLNSDAWLVRKKGFAFMPFAERQAIVSALKMVDQCVAFNDSDGTALKLITDFVDDTNEFVFANGGDRTEQNIPEMSLCLPNLVFAFGVGGEDKKNSSSWITNSIAKGMVAKPWGFYQVLYENKGIKAKRLVVNPKAQLSLQRHAYRNEYWQVVKGSASVYIDGHLQTLAEKQTAAIDIGAWHQLTNHTNTPLEILEVQSGFMCVEEDIERVFKTP
jgi:D-beta-D-heptose 7-phosphate kinase/D-beta-D-heptose 1-phosphate adenosyltransferase